MLRSKFLKNIMALSLSVIVIAGSTLSANANVSENDTNGSGYNGSGYNGSGYESSGSGSGSKGSAGSTSVNLGTSSVKAADGKVSVTTVAGQYTSKKFLGTIVSTQKALVNTSLGVKAGETAYIKISDSFCGPLAQQCVTDVAKSMGAKAGPMLDIFAGKISKNGKYTDIDKAAAAIEFKVGTPLNFKAAAGTEIAVLRVQKGGAVTVLPDMDQDPNTITFKTSGFGVFALIQVPAGSLNSLKIS